LPISAIDAIVPALHHTKDQLFQRFQFGQWAKLAFVGLLAGELTTASCGNFNGNFRAPQHPNQFVGSPFPHIDPVLLALLIGLLITVGFVFGILLMYVSSVMRFILFDSVVERHCDIGKGWMRRQSAGARYFLWRIAFLVVVGMGFVVLIGLPVIFAFGAGWLTKPKEHIAPLILCGMAVFLVAIVFVLVAGTVHVFTKDFVIPQMALENVSAFQGWERLLPMLGQEKGAYFGYALMKIVMALGVGIVLGIVTTIAVLISLIPVGGLGAAALILGKGAGLEWNVYTITLAVVVGCIWLAALLYLVSIISVPAMVFFPAYSIYFFASRYPALGMVVNPGMPVVPVPPVLPMAPLQPE
jgi:hypothetical protein